MAGQPSYCLWRRSGLINGNKGTIEMIDRKRI